MMDFKPTFEYRVTFAEIPRTFPDHSRIPQDLAKISPKPPKGEDWQLAEAVCIPSGEGSVVLYYWEREARERQPS